MNNNYEDLIGKIIDWSNPNWKDNKVFKVVVANIDPDLGISLVNPDDLKIPLPVCMGRAAQSMVKCWIQSIRMFLGMRDLKLQLRQ